MFNEEQQKAIETIKGQLILVACPGSGKTTTLLGRIHEMIQQGVPAENILMVTFTTAAAGEMKQRFWKKYAEDGKAPHYSSNRKPNINCSRSFCLNGI